MGPSLAGEVWGDGASAHKAVSGRIGFLPEGEHVWRWFPALAMTCKAPVHREQEAAQTLLVPMASNGLGEKSESAAFLNKQPFGLSLVSPGEFHFRESSCQKLVLCLSEIDLSCVAPSVAKCGVLGPVYTRLFQAPSAFSPKEDTFGVGFQLQRTLS